jgi:hypothetical protein
MDREAEVAIDSLGIAIHRKAKTDHQREDKNPKKPLSTHCHSFLKGFEIDIVAQVHTTVHPNPVAKSMASPSCNGPSLRSLRAIFENRIGFGYHVSRMEGRDHLTLNRY